MSRTMMDSDPTGAAHSQPDSASHSRPDRLPASPPQSASAANPQPDLSAPRFALLRRESALSPFAEIFEGPQGLYPAARWLIYFVMAVVIWQLLTSLAIGFRPKPIPLWWSMVKEAIRMIAAILPAFLMTRIEGVSFGEFGLPTKGAFGRNFWAGAIWGIASLTVLMLVFRTLGVFSFGSLSLHGARIFKFGLYYAVFFVIVSFFEDFFMRGYSQWVLTQGMNFWPAAALLSILFGLGHLLNPGEAKIGIVAVVCIGFLFCLTLRRTGTLWWAIGFHMTWDWGESYLYSVPDSGGVAPGHLLNSSFHGPDWLTGGSVGPEGSYLVFVLLAAVWILFSRVYPEVRYRIPERS